MNWRKSNRWLHRQVGFLFFGMTIIYGISGIALNHHIARHWNPSMIEKRIQLEGIQAQEKNQVDRDYIEMILEIAVEKDNYKQYYFPTDESLMIYLNKGHILVDLESGDAQLVKIRTRRFFKEVNFLHYNKPKNLWTYFADLFAFSMIVLAVSGIIMVKGKKGMRGSGGVLFAVGLIIPLIFLIIYLW